MATDAAPLRIVFAGTPDFAASHLALLLGSRHSIVAVYSQPDRPAGRGKKLAASPVKQLAQEHGITVLQPENFRDEFDRTALAALQPDLMIVVAYGLLLPQAVLDIPRLGCINVHASLLPRWRGAAPIQRAIEAGDEETGVCIMQMEAGLDTGPVLSRLTCPILQDDTAGTLHDRLAALGPPALLEAVEKLATGHILSEKQDDLLATYAHKLAKEEAKIDFRRPARALERQIRAFNPFPVSWCLLPNGERLRVWKAIGDDRPHNAAPGTVLAINASGVSVACGAGALLMTELQLPNRSRMPVRDIINGQLLAVHPGDSFS